MTMDGLSCRKKEGWTEFQFNDYFSIEAGSVDGGNFRGRDIWLEFVTPGNQYCPARSSEIFMQSATPTR